MALLERDDWEDGGPDEGLTMTLDDCRERRAEEAAGAHRTLTRSTSLQMLLAKIAISRRNMNIYPCSRRERTGYWISIFKEAFFPPGDSIYKDDLLFFVLKSEESVQTGSYCKPSIRVFRRTSSRLPASDDRTVDWEETVYINLIMQHFTYILTVAVITRTGPQEYQILKKVSHKVYASPSKRDMDNKGTEEEITYPYIYFSVDNFEEVFSECIVRDSESVCVELTAYDHKGLLQGVVFFGTVRYGTLKGVFDSRNSLSNRLAKNTVNWFKSSKRIEFIRMLGPDGKGHSQVALSAIESMYGSDRHLDSCDYEPNFAYDNSKMATSFTNGTSSFSVENSPSKRPSDDPSNMRFSQSRNHANGKPSKSKVADLVAGGKTVRNVLNSKIKKSQSDGNTFDGMGLQKLDDSDREAAICSEDFDEYSLLTSTWGQSFSQAWYWFKEKRKACSVGLSVSVTYVSIPWHRIIGDVLDTKLKPVLTFDNIPIE